MRRRLPTRLRRRLHRLRHQELEWGLELLWMLLVAKVPSATLRHVAYRRMGLGLDPRAHISKGLELRGAPGATIGQGTIVGFDCILDGRGGLTIGEHVNLSSEAAIWTYQHDLRAPDFSVIGRPVAIGDRAWLSFRCTVLPGVTIGEGAVVAAGAVVTEDVAPWTVVAGIPARKVADRPRAGYEFDVSFVPWIV
jgi:acetyltransferase-like isoleucine patch superfamily enzyme